MYKRSPNFDKHCLEDCPGTPRPADEAQSQNVGTSSPNEISWRSMAHALRPTMTVREFVNGYWYLDQLKDFAEHIGIPAAKKLRKDELEKAIVAFLRTGNVAVPTK